MAGTAPREPAIILSGAHAEDFVVSELASSEAGAHSPFGPDVVVPLPFEKLQYKHPRPEDRPNLAEGR
jgi:hypothetical protein